MLARHARMLLAGAVVALASAGTAQAATVNLGQLESAGATSAGAYTLVQTAATNHTIKVPPGSWVVTSVSGRVMLAGSSPTASVDFFRPTANAHEYTTVSRTPLPVETSVESKVYTQPTSFNVQGGDLLSFSAGNGVALGYLADAGATYDYETGPPPADPFKPTGIQSGSIFSVAAGLEPDADADRIPDAQDNCAGTAACRTDLEGLVQINPSSVLRGRTAQVAVTVNNRGTDPASAVTAAVSLPKGITVLSSGLPSACPLRQTLLTCSFGTLDRGAQRTVYVRVRATTEGTKTISLLAAQSGADPATGNNRSQIALTVRKTCVVPSKGLKGQTLKTAKRRLKAAGCSRTRTVKPKRVPRGYVLRVSDVSPRATQEATRRITITLKARKRKS